MMSGLIITIFAHMHTVVDGFHKGPTWTITKSTLLQLVAIIIIIIPPIPAKHLSSTDLEHNRELVSNSITMSHVAK